jgi:hypothetical protein
VLDREDMDRQFGITARLMVEAEAEAGEVIHTMLRQDDHNMEGVNRHMVPMIHMAEAVGKVDQAHLGA